MELTIREFILSVLLPTLLLTFTIVSALALLGPALAMALLSTIGATSFVILTW